RNHLNEMNSSRQVRRSPQSCVPASPVAAAFHARQPARWPARAAKRLRIRQDRRRRHAQLAVALVSFDDNQAGEREAAIWLGEPPESFEGGLETRKARGVSRGMSRH